MADTVRTLAALQALLADNGSGLISPQDLRDFLVSVFAGRGGAAAVADGGTIAHGLGVTPSSVQLTGSVASQVVSVAGLDATNITVAIKNSTTGVPGTTETIYWMALP